MCFVKFYMKLKRVNLVPIVSINQKEYKGSYCPGDTLYATNNGFNGSTIVYNMSRIKSIVIPNSIFHVGFRKIFIIVPTLAISAFLVCLIYKLFVIIGPLLFFGIPIFYIILLMLTEIPPSMHHTYQSYVISRVLECKFDEIFSFYKIIEADAFNIWKRSLELEALHNKYIPRYSSIISDLDPSTLKGLNRQSGWKEFKSFKDDDFGIDSLIDDDAWEKRLQELHRRIDLVDNER